MEKKLNRTCKKHGLTAISVAHNPKNGDRYAATVYVHWGDDGCVSSNGPTFDAALAGALKEMADRQMMREEAA